MKMKYESNEAKRLMLLTEEIFPSKNRLNKDLEYKEEIKEEINNQFNGQEEIEGATGNFFLDELLLGDQD